MAAFRNAALLVSGMSGEKQDRFVEGLKTEIAFEVCKDYCMTFSGSRQMALRVESARSEMNTRQSTPLLADFGQTSMEIGNLWFCSVRMNLIPMSATMTKQLEDYLQNRCYVCQEVGRSARNYKYESEKENIKDLKNGNSRKHFLYAARP